MCDHCGCREFAPIAELTADHEEILRLAWEVAEARSHAAPKSLSDLIAILDSHVRKEEAGLYPLLAGLGSLPEARRTALEAEHVELGQALRDRNFGRHDYYALAAHIEEEETELFSAARFGFEDEEWERLEAAHRLDRAPRQIAN